MPDVSVTVNNAPIQVTSCISNVIDVSVATAGSQGATGPIGPTGVTGPAGSNGSVGITGISVTGYYSQTGLINFTGAGSTVVLTGLNNTIIFSGTADTSNFSTIAQFNALSGNVYATGQTLNNRINLLSGYNDNYFVHRLGNEDISGVKTFADLLNVTYGFVQGDSNTINNNSSFIHGVSNTANGAYSHVEGAVNTTIGDYSHAEGASNTASGSYSHVEGTNNLAIGGYSHAEGISTIAYASYSHSEGLSTIASGLAQLAIGQYNMPDNTSLFIVGNGSGEDLDRSNAFLINQSGAVTNFISGLNAPYSINLRNGKFNYHTGVIINLNARQLNDLNYNFSIDWENKVLFNNEWPIVDWQNCSLTSYLGAIAANWQLRYLYDSDGNYSIDWSGRKLFNPSDGAVNLDWRNKTLSGLWSTSGLKANFITGLNSTAGIDLVNGIIYIGGQPSIDFNSKQLNNNVGNPTIRWNNYIFNDSSQNTAIDWNNRLLKTDVVTTTIDWSGKIISGTWNAQAIRVSGASLITGVDTGSFASIVNLLSTGQNLFNLITGFSGVFNNSGGQYQSQLNTLTTNLTNTGVNILSILANYTGYNNTNPSGYATASNLQSTGQALDNKINNWGVRQLNNLSGQLTISGAGNLTAQNSGTNTIFISGDVSNLATTSNLQTTGSTLNNKINTLSGYVDNTFALLSSPRIFIGSGSPEGSIQAVSGSLYTDWYNQTFYMKISGNSSNAYGWV